MESSEQQQDQEHSRWTQFGAWLEKIREDRGGGLTRKAAAAQAGMSYQQLNILEHGGWRRDADGPWLLPNPKDKVLRDLARVLGVPVEQMYEQVGHYEDRPQTQRSGRRQANITKRRNRLEELEERIQVLEERVAAYPGTTSGRGSRRKPAG
jgi:transcriptional regulator with XRE-family HTH domain